MSNDIVIEAIEPLYFAYMNLYGQASDHGPDDFLDFMVDPKIGIHPDTRIQLGVNTIRVVRGSDQVVKTFDWTSSGEPCSKAATKELAESLFEGYITLVEEQGDYVPRKEHKDSLARALERRDRVSRREAEVSARRTLLGFFGSHLNHRPSINLRFTRTDKWKCHLNTLEVDGVVGPTLQVYNDRVIAA